MKVKAIHAKAIYDILMAVCHAPATHKARFISALGEETEDMACEWRILGGNLGFGGKFKWGFDGWRVTCYYEDETPERRLAIAKANTMLARLQQPWYVTFFNRLLHISEVKSFGRAKLSP